ncbi:uncharacterized protein LOC115621884 [Scaptodrosophila lebanonensis]|uniref:Uncharacterized protein LOC115621884 n=1 Tax=Drosophila lebanonensis TaxID=7225 RepID=A0A6J2T3T9_DROLE|nr:uncharacterized protein LOC115621884 [Scaptodrosophila lebanonensis]
MLQAVACQPYTAPHRCSNRLENALEHMRRRSSQTKSSRSLWDRPNQSPYDLYHSFYGQHSDPEEDFYNIGSTGRGYHAKHMQRRTRPHQFVGTGAPSDALELEQLLASQQHRQPHKLAISRVDVEDLKVRVPPGKSATRWVEIDKCKFSTENSTLDTRLIFPDLTLSGKVVLQPTGGRCHMILRLRHAGIEFRTVPIGFESAAGHEQSRRLGAASVRTDSHFAEPGFISVFAHGCQGPSGIRYRQNSKRRFGFAGYDGTSSPPPPPSAPQVELGEPHIIMGSTGSQRWGKYHKPDYDIRSGYQHQEQTTQRDHSLSFDSHELNSHEFYDVNGDNFYRRQFSKRRRRELPNRRRRQLADEINFNEDVLHFSDEQLQQMVEPDARAFADIFSGGEREQLVGDAMSNELEKLFSMGVRGLLTTYMQRALQPAIKETLMENMGYTLSYG